MDQAQINRIARAYVQAPHQPYHESYKAFVSETVQQFEDMTDKDWVYVLWRPGTITMPSSEAFRILDNMSVMEVATDGSPLARSHPLGLPSWDGQGATANWKIVTVNSKFRAVHDYYGHYFTYSPFETLEGELQAYRNHKRFYSKAAQAALFGETIGQLCYYYSFGEFVPIQKCVILPVEEI